MQNYLDPDESKESALKDEQNYLESYNERQEEYSHYE